MNGVQRRRLYPGPQHGRLKSLAASVLRAPTFQYVFTLIIWAYVTTVIGLSLETRLIATMQWQRLLSPLVPLFILTLLSEPAMRFLVEGRSSMHDCFQEARVDRTQTCEIPYPPHALAT